MINFFYDAPEEAFLQWSGQTKINRFPKIFARVKQLRPNPRRILSFGCSTGEECSTLAELFPRAEILGVDVNRWSLNRAKETITNPRISFSKKIKGSFDLVLSLMVLFSMWKPIPLEKWAETVSSIDEHIKVGGLWAIYTSQFHLKKSDVYKNYKPFRQWRRTHSTDNKKYYCGYYEKIQGR